MLMWMPVLAPPFGAGRVFENRLRGAGSAANRTGAGLIVPSIFVDRGQCEY